MTKQHDRITVKDRSTRRHFIRSGTAFLLGGATVFSGQALADCDGQQQTRCSDEDTGTAADRDGCGRCGRVEHVPSSSHIVETEASVNLVKITYPVDK